MFRIDIYFTEYRLAVEIDEKGYTNRDSKFEKLRQEALKKELNCKFIRIYTSTENFNVDYEPSRIQLFISQFKDNKVKEKINKNKKLEDEIKEKDNKNKELEDEIKKIKVTISKFRYKK